MARPARILLTGPPGCGKTTIVLRTLRLLDRPAAGFYTEEVRSAGGPRSARAGFDVVALDGRRGSLARIGAPGPRVARYGVDLPSFEAVGVRSLEEGLRRPEAVLVIDEIGKMELLSHAFAELLPEVFRHPNPVLGTILLTSHPVADRIRRMPGVRVLRASRENRDRLPEDLAAAFTA